jgi:dipeptidyl aminopeptidase/acylaminoacyl peptidase
MSMAAGALFSNRKSARELILMKNLSRAHASMLVIIALLFTSLVAPAQQSAPTTANSATDIAIFPPGDSLRAEGLPPIPAALAEEVRRYTEFRTAGFADWHPTRREILISTRFGDTNQLHEVRAPGAARVQRTFFSENVGGGNYEPKQGSYFLFSKDRGGDEFAQLYRYDTATGDTTLLTDGGRSQNGGAVWSTGGERIVYASTRRNGGDRDIYVMNPRDPKSDRLLLQVTGGGWGALDWSPDDKQIIVGESRSINDSSLHIVDVASGERRPLTEKTAAGAETVAYSGAEFATDGRGFYTTTDRGGEFMQLTYVELASGKHTALSGDIRGTLKITTSRPTARS